MEKWKSGHPTINKFNSDDFWYTSPVQPPICWTFSNEEKQDNENKEKERQQQENGKQSSKNNEENGIVFASSIS